MAQLPVLILANKQDIEVIRMRVKIALDSAHCYLGPMSPDEIATRLNLNEELEGRD